MTPHKFYNVTGEGAGGSAEDNIAAVALRFGVAANNTHNAVNILKAMRAYADQEVAQHEYRRHLSPFPPIPRDIISFWDEGLKKPITCPDESRYFEWCYWMFKNEHQVHQIQLENEVDKVVYTVGDKRENGEIKSLHWRGNYWSYRNEKGDGISINGPIKGDNYHRDRFQRKSEESPSPSPGLRWTSIKDGLPVVGRQVMLFAEYLHRGKLSSEMFIGWLGENGECYKGYDDEEDYGWTFEECITYWAPMPLGPQEFPSLPGEQEEKPLTELEQQQKEFWYWFDTHFRSASENHDHASTGEKASYWEGYMDAMSAVDNNAPEIVAREANASAEKGEQVEGKGKDLSDFCQMLIDARQYKGLSIAEAEDGAHIAHGYLVHLEAGKYNQPSVHALYYLAKLYDIELKPLLVAGGVIVKRGQESSPPSVEADQQVPRQSIADVCGNIPVSEAFRIAKWVDAETESLIQSVENWEWKYHQAEKEIATLKESFKSSTYQHDQDMEIMKGKSNELRDLLNILNEGYSDHFTKFINDRMYKALNTFPNNTKGE